MKEAIILAAGRSRRLGAMANEYPKCLIPLDEDQNTIMGIQLAHLISTGFERVLVVTGYKSDKIEDFIKSFSQLIDIEIIFNPVWEVSNNIISLWLALQEANSDFTVINGDNAFNQSIPQTVVNCNIDGIVLAISKKANYDEDDMKVTLDGDRLLAVGKDIPLSRTHGESIGFVRFSGNGAALIRNATETVLREKGPNVFWLNAIDRIAKENQVSTLEFPSSSWAELDFPDDLVTLKRALYRFLPENRPIKYDHPHVQILDK